MKGEKIRVEIRGSRGMGRRRRGEVPPDMVACTSDTLSFIIGL